MLVIVIHQNITVLSFGNTVTPFIVSFYPNVVVEADRQH